MFPVHSPRIAKIEVEQEGAPRRSKLYYLRDRKGKEALYVKPRTKAAKNAKSKAKAAKAEKAAAAV